MAMWDMAVVAVAPRQCFSPGGNQMMSPGRISSTGPPSRWTQPQPAVTMSVWPSGWVCHAGGLGPIEHRIDGNRFF
jgi:hypothetical protein